ncbi:MAG: ABC transporter permease [Candidatus Anstonellales archaeon]
MIELNRMLSEGQEYLLYAIESMKHRSLRSWLTIIGVIVGIAAIVVLVSIGQGLNDSIQSQLKNFGANTIVIIPGKEISVQTAFSRANYKPPSVGKLYKSDVERIKKLEGVEYVSAVIQASADVRYKTQSITAFLTGIEPSLFRQTQLLEIEKGRMLVETDRQVAVIGRGIAYNAFDNEIEIGSFVYVGNEQKKFRIVGILKGGGGSGQAGRMIDSAFYIPIEDARDIAEKSLVENEVSAIRLTIEKDRNMEEMKEIIESELLSAHKLKKDERDFSLITADYISKQVEQITGILTLFLGGIAAVSLIVGGVGIANTMFTAVVERTPEVGILKSIGASRKKIEKIFLVESGLIGAIGGACGIIIGVAAALGLNILGGIPTSINAAFVGFCFVFSISVGLLSGYFPAKKAAELDPVDALRRY